MPICMYAKHGKMHKAWELFDKMHAANIVYRNVIITRYAIHGYNKDALKLFDLFKHPIWLHGHIINNVES